MYRTTVSGDAQALGDSQQSNLNLLTLERNSYNFLEYARTRSCLSLAAAFDIFYRYAKMQLNTFPSGTSKLGFDDVVPKLSTTRHVAAAAFYHCLGTYGVTPLDYRVTACVRLLTIPYFCSLGHQGFGRRVPGRSIWHN